MNLSFLDKESKVTPLLVQLYDSQRLNALSTNQDSAVKAELTSAICELMEMELSPREAELVSDVMIGLLHQAEMDFRQALAERLAKLDSVPLRLILKMASDDIEVSGSILRESSVLTDLDLIYIVKSHGAAHWQAIAEREVMSDQVMNLLADTGDVETAIKLSENQLIVLNEYTVNKLADMAKASDRLALPLLRREEVSADMAKMLYQFVGQEIKAFIESEYGVKSGAIAGAVEEVLLDFVDATEDENEFMPTSAMLKDATRQKEKGLLTIKLMLASLRRGHIKPFVAQFTKYTGLDASAVLEILEQESGQGLAVACKAFDIAKEDFVSIYLLSNRVRNQTKMVELSGMGKAINYYTKIDKAMAQNIIKNSRVED